MNSQTILQSLGQQTPLIAPSMLKCDFGNLHREVQLLESAGAPLLHLDVMDGHFVPNLSYGPMVIERLRELTSLPFDAHLMISDPAKYLDEYLRVGCDMITIHIEAVPDPGDILKQIRDAGALAGLALNPKTAVDAILPYTDLCDLVLVMSVEPGFGGQAFIPDVLEKVRRLRTEVSPETFLSIDGGIGLSTIEQAAAAGANLFVAGSSIFDTPSYKTAISELRQKALAGSNSSMTA